MFNHSLLGDFFRLSVTCFAGGDEAGMEGPGILFREGDEAGEGHHHFGHRKELVELYDRLRPGLYRYLICLGLKPQESEDTIQESFLRLFRFQAGGGKLENPRSWLFRVAHNLCRDVHKAERQFISDEIHADADDVLERPDPALNPEDLLLQKEQYLRLEAAMAQLTERQRQFVHLRAEGLRYREIAEVQGTTVSNVNETLRRAIVRIMEKLYE
jgi:RNA polymerase sigma-70 factor, ECF subfamily